LWAIEHGRVNDGRTYRTHNLCNVVDLTEILADEKHKRNAVPQFDELHSTARDIGRVPPPNLGVKRAA
jgi:hypothetical protein